MNRRINFYILFLLAISFHLISKCGGTREERKELYLINKTGKTIDVFLKEGGEYKEYSGGIQNGQRATLLINPGKQTQAQPAIAYAYEKDRPHTGKVWEAANYLLLPTLGELYNGAQANKIIYTDITPTSFSTSGLTYTKLGYRA